MFKKYVTLQILLTFLIIISNSMNAQKNNNMILLSKNWLIQSSKIVPEKGDKISLLDFNPVGWYKAEVPTTVMNALVKNGLYENIFFGRNFENIPTEQFKNSWWFLTKFSLPKSSDKNTYKLQFDGIIYRAVVWLNGNPIANSDQISGTFRLFEIDITQFIRNDKENILALEVFPPQPGEPNHGFVDWNPKPPDNSMGIWREVRVKICRDVAIKYPFIKTNLDTEKFGSAELTISVEVQNNSNKKISGSLDGKIEKISFSKKIDLEPKENKLITITPAEFNQLKIKNPRVWWTHDLGKPELYKLNLAFKVQNIISDEISTNFGIRTISDYINEKGWRGYKLNGKKILIKGGGWTDDVLMNNESIKLENQIRYVKFMNLNTIRLEGFWGTSEEIYNLCDKYGILIMAGWSCQWEWENLIGKKTDNFGGISTPEEIQLIAQSWKDQIKWLRNHPSIIIWAYGSDLLPRPALEEEYQKVLKADDPTRPFIASAKLHTSKITGSTAVKMFGPYEYETPNYWWIDTANGGAYGFNTETGPGPQVPPMESLLKMIPKDSIWPMNSLWNFHCCRGKFKDLGEYNKALNARYGESKSAEEYAMKSQMSNYEAIRGMFEAFVAKRYISTGVIQWMLNSAWPKLWWQLYDYYLMPTGAFYGTKKSCEPIHIYLDYKTNKIFASNFTTTAVSDLHAMITVYEANSTKLYNIEKKNINLAADQIIEIGELNKLTPKSAYFADMRILDKKNNLLSTNFYWLSSKQDILDWKGTTWWYTPIKEYTDFKDLNNMPKAELKVKSKFNKKGETENFEIELENPSQNLSFFNEILITKNKDGESILPVFIDDNYISLLPGEKRIIKGSYFSRDLEGKKPFLKINGWNSEIKY